MSAKHFCIAILLLLLTDASCAQTEDVPLSIRLTSSPTKDSLWLTVNTEQYQKPSSLMVFATLTNSRLTDTIFLPVVDSESVFCLVVPPGIRDDLILRGYFFPGVFTISGHLNTRRKQPNIRVILLTDNNAFYNKEIVLNEANEFSLPPMVFEKRATLVFNYPNSDRSKDHPDIVLNSVPYASNFKQLLFIDTIKYHDETFPLTPGDSLSTIAAIQKAIATSGIYKTMKEVNVKGKIKTKLEKFDETYSTGVFKDFSERMIDCLEDESILRYGDCISFLQTRVPGLFISRGMNAVVQLKWRGVEVKAFYIDEMQVDIDQLMTVSTSDIAMIKTYPPPFWGSSTNGDGGAIAVYTRRGEYRRADSNESKWLFKVKGYSPSMYVLFGGNQANSRQ